MAASALQYAPAKKYAPKSVLYQIGDSDITRSNARTE